MVPAIPLMAQALKHLAQTPPWFVLSQLSQLLGDFAVIFQFSLIAVHAPAEIHEPTSMSFTQLVLPNSVSGQLTTLVYRYNFFSTISFST